MSSFNVGAECKQAKLEARGKDIIRSEVLLRSIKESVSIIYLDRVYNYFEQYILKIIKTL
jgi:hypothetical protein